MKWSEDKPRVSFWTLLFGSALGAAIATVLGQLINWAQTISH